MPGGVTVPCRRASSPASSSSLVGNAGADDAGDAASSAETTTRASRTRGRFMRPDPRGPSRLERFKILRKTAAVPSAADLERLLRDADLRVTGQRTAVLAAVHDHPHADTDSLIGVARERLGAVSHQAVYDVLRALTDAGLVRRIQPA